MCFELIKFVLCLLVDVVMPAFLFRVGLVCSCDHDAGTVRCFCSLVEFASLDVFVFCFVGLFAFIVFNRIHVCLLGVMCIKVAGFELVVL